MLTFYQARYTIGVWVITSKWGNVLVGLIGVK